MDKENSKFFSFVYKIIHFIFLLPINAIKYFCFGFYFVNLMCARIILFIMMIVSYPVYKMFKYLCLSLTFPIMIYNILRRNIKKNQNNSIEAPNNFEKEILDNNSLDLNKINDSVELDEINNNIEPNDPIIDIDSILAMDKLENKPFDLLDDGKIDIIDEQFFDLYANETQDNQQFIQENNNNESTIELFDNNKETEDANKENVISESIRDLPKKVKPKRNNYLIGGLKRVFRWFGLGIFAICLPVYKVFKYFIFGILWPMLVLKKIFIYVSFTVYKLAKYLLFSLTLPIIILNVLKRRRRRNFELKEEARLKRQEEKFKKQLEKQRRKEEKLRSSIEKKKKNEYVNENAQLEKKSLGQQLNESLNKLFALPGVLVNKIKKSYQNSVFVKNYRNQRDMSRQVLLIDFEGEDAKKSDIKLVYQYTAKNADGKVVTDYMEAFSKVEVHSFLLSEGYEVYNIKTNGWIQFAHKSSTTSKTKIKNKDLIFFLNQLSTYIKAGIPLVDSLKILARQYAKQKKYQKLFRTIIYDLSMGDSFSTALSKQGDAFPRILINMVKASEMTGELPEVLDDMAEYFTEMDKTKKQMVTALMYPLIILIIAVGVVVFILLFVIPKFVNIYESMDAAKVPKFTLFVLAVSDFLKANFLYLIIGILLTVVVLVYLYKNVKAFRVIAQWIFMHVPVFGNVIIYNEVTTFTKTFSSLLAHNVFITDSMEILNKVTNNEIFKMLILDTITNLAKGEKISTSFKDHWAFPVPAYEMLVTGERTGQLPEMMGKVASYYQELHRNSVTRIKTFVEPILIVFLTLIVGVIVLAIVIPMFSLYESVQSYG